MSTKVIGKDNVLKGAVVLLAILLTQGTAYSSGSEVPGKSPASVDLSSMPLDNAKEQAEFLSQGINVSPSIAQIMNMVDPQTLESVFPDGLTTYLEQDFTDRVPEELIGVDLSSYKPITVVQDGAETIVGYVKKGDIVRSFFD
jgi:hypothetical protein